MYHPQNDHSQPPRRGLKANSSATMAELRQFLSQVRGRSPQEMLGLIAQSGLSRGMMLSTIIMAVLVFAGTALPFAVSQLAGKPKQQDPTATAPADEQADEKTKKTETADAKKSNEKADPKEAILDKLGIGQTKKVPKGFNPLENRAEDILKDLEKR